MRLSPGLVILSETTMAVKLVLWLSLIIGILAPAQADGWRCGKIAEALDGIFQFLDVYWGGMPHTQFQMDQISVHLGYQLDTPEGFHQLACDIVESPDLESLATTTGIPVFRLEHHYGFLERVIEEYGGWDSYLYNREAHFFIYKHVVDWYRSTGFPNVPANTTFSDAVDFLSNLKNMMGKMTFDETYFLVDYLQRVSVKDIANAMVDSSSQEDLRQKLQCSDHEWEYISQESGLELDYKRYINNPNNVHRLITTAYNIEVLPYLNAGDVTLPSPPPECAAVFDVFVEVIRETKQDLYSTEKLLSAAQFLDMDVFDPAAVSQFACDVAACEEFDDLAALLNMSVSYAELLRRDAMRGINWSYGDREGIERTIDLVEHVEDFCDRSGYPIFPLYDVTLHDVVQFFDYFQSPEDFDRGITSRVVRHPFPVDRFNATYLADVFMATTDFDEMYAALDPTNAPTNLGTRYYRRRIATYRREAEIALHLTDVATELGFMDPI